MGDVLAELEEVLRSKSNRGKISAQEELVLQTCKSKAIRDFTFGFCASSATVWTATRRLAQAMRFNLSLGSAIFFGMWSFDRSLSGCLNQIMAIEGSRIQRELANIILTKHENDTSRMKLVSKYFYPERVFNDQNQDMPIFRWRLRHVYMDNSTTQRTEPEHSSSNHDKIKQPNQSAGSPLVGVGDWIVDPLECIFSFPETTIMEMSNSENVEVPRRRTRAKKRGSHRYQHHHSETS